MSDSDSSTLSYEEPVLDGVGIPLVVDGIRFPESINYFARRTLQADEEPAALIPVYIMRGPAGDLIGSVDRLLLQDYHYLKYVLKLIVFDKNITGQFYVQFKIWSEKDLEGTRECLNNVNDRYIRRPLKEMTVEGIYLAKRRDIVLDYDLDLEDDDEPDDGWFEDDGRRNNELLSFYQDDNVTVLLLLPNNPVRNALGWVFWSTSTNLGSLKSQISFCAARAGLQGSYRPLFKDVDGDDCLEPEGDNDEEWHAFGVSLSEIELHV